MWKLAILLFCILLAFPCEARIVYVDAESPGANNGSSWTDAHNFMQDALAQANSSQKPVEIRVAQGVYLPDKGGGTVLWDREATFQLIGGVALYGGYAGHGEPDPNDHDIRRYETILSGDLNGNDLDQAVPADFRTERTRAENSYHVVTGSNADETAILDGFTVTGGHADGPYLYRSGAGICNDAGHPTIANCTFKRNWALQAGGAMLNRSSSRPVVVQCKFIANAASGSGGAVYNYLASDATFVNCSFTGNLGGRVGGAIDNYSTVTLINCTLCGNSARTAGGLAHYYGTVSNCILWANSDDQGSSEPAQIILRRPASVAFSRIQGWTGSLGGSGNAGADPLLSDADGADNLFGTIDDNLRLLPGSACLNSGDNTAVPPGLTVDLDGNPRIIDGAVDIGAYEGPTQTILLSTESLTVPEGQTNSFAVSLAMAPQASIEVTIALVSGDTDIAVLSGATLVFDSDDYSTPQMVTVSASEDADYLNGVALIRAESDNFAPVGVTIHEQDNELTTGIVYVDDDATGLGDGMTWTDAYSSLQDALRTAALNPQVWEIHAARGVYRPDEGERAIPGDRQPRFELISGVVIKGGYAGLGAADADARDVKLYETILSGDLNDDDNGFAGNGENSYHVVTGSDVNATAVLDGFTITAGNANGADYPEYCGGGMFNLRGTPTIIDCLFTGNSANNRGGGMYSHEGGPTARGCIFSNNFAGVEGGGIYNHHQGPTLTNCLINGNFAVINGGGIGGDHLYMGDLTMTNCTIVGNEAGEKGGGMFEYDRSDLYLSNCIIWGNSAYEGPQMALTTVVNAFIRHSCFEGGQLDIFTELNSYAHWGPGNAKADPRFADVLAGDYHLKSRAGRWNPNSKSWVTDDVSSPCIDTGDPASAWTAELWPHGKQINMGAFGGTPQASMSRSAVGNVADLNNSNKVDFADIRLLADKWLKQQTLLPEDLDRNGSVDSKDFAVFGRQWLWKQ